MCKVLIVEARFYDTIQDMLLNGAMRILEKKKISFETITVKGALEIPTAIVLAENSRSKYDGYIALGCIIRGDTTHYDHVCSQSFRGIMDLSIGKGLVIGNGILTVENKSQALIRADINAIDKGGFAASACLALLNIKNSFTQE